MSFQQKITLSIVAIGLSSCALLDRHRNSGYYGYNSTEPTGSSDFYQQRRDQNEQETKDELGFQPTQSLNENEKMVLEQRLQLKRLESSIPTRREKQQYYRYKAFLPGDSARIYFLQIPTIEARERWANKMGASDEENQGYSEDMAKLIESNEVIIGMSQKAVTESWGDPDIIEVAGNPIYRNECWKYSKYISSEDGYHREMRLIYFEAGRVVGWETL